MKIDLGKMSLEKEVFFVVRKWSPVGERILNRAVAALSEAVQC